MSKARTTNPQSHKSSTSISSQQASAANAMYDALAEMDRKAAEQYEKRQAHNSRVDKIMIFLSGGALSLIAYIIFMTFNRG